MTWRKCSKPFAVIISYYNHSPSLKHDYSFGENQITPNFLGSKIVLSVNGCNWKANMKKINNILKPRKLIFHTDKNLSGENFQGFSKMLYNKYSVFKRQATQEIPLAKPRGLSRWNLLFYVHASKKQLHDSFWWAC